MIQPVDAEIVAPLPSERFLQYGSAQKTVRVDGLSLDIESARSAKKINILFNCEGLPSNVEKQTPPSIWLNYFSCNSKRQEIIRTLFEKIRSPTWSIFRTDIGLVHTAPQYRIFLKEDRSCTCTRDRGIVLSRGLLCEP